MSYQSLQFLFFTALVLLVYYLAGRKRQTLVLALANLAFYAVAGIKYLPFLLITMVSVFLCARAMGRIYKETDTLLAGCADPAEKKALRARGKTRARRALFGGMFVTIALLAVCKYALFVVQNINLALSAFSVPQIPLFKMILPLGISFYSFMALSYLLDVYWKRYPAEENFLPFAAYLSYFPHVVQGPIDRYNEFSAQIKEGVAFDYQNLAFGSQLMLWGFFKKLVVADRLGLFVDTAFLHWNQYKGFVMIAAVAVYSIQIYADFSGCIDIVTGVSQMFGIELRKNFNHPYFSRTMAEFWRRWHISLQEWFKDYVYFPVSASSLMKKGKKYFKAKDQKRAMELFAACFPILVVWLITGLWHGAAWKFVAWGIFHACLLIGSRILEPAFQKASQTLRLNTDSLPWQGVQMARTFCLCCLGRVFFRAANLGDAFGILKKMLRPAITLKELLNPPVFYGLSMENILVAVFAVIVLLAVDIIQEKTCIRQALSRRSTALRWFLIYACLFSVLFFGIYGPGYGEGGFIYEQF